MARFFFGFQLGHESLYRKFAQRIKEFSWKGNFVTFNYERLLELALKTTWLEESDLRERLCYPHGCCHIFCSTTGTPTSVEFNNPGDGLWLQSGGRVTLGEDDAAYSNITTTGAVTFIKDQQEHQRLLQNNSFPPIIPRVNPRLSRGTHNV